MSITTHTEIYFAGVLTSVFAVAVGTAIVYLLDKYTTIFDTR